MALTPKLEMRQGQALVMTPQLQQAIKLLQLSSLDLAAYVEQELERNPLLDRAEEEGEPDGAADAAGPAPAADGEWSRLEFADTPDEVAATLDTDVDNVFPDDTGAAGAPAGKAGLLDSGWSALGGGQGGSFEPNDYDLEAVIGGEVTLRDHLGEQLALATGDPVERLIGQHLIDMVDEAGYLAGDPGEVATRLGADAATVDRVLALVQGFDPPGVGARDLAECLALQLRDKDRYDPAMQALIGNIELLARREFDRLKRLTGADDEDLAEMIAEVKALDPKPGLRFGTVLVQPVVPDIFVRPRPDGSWHIELNSDALPKVLVNRDYHATLARNSLSENDRAYLVDCLQTANWLVKSLDQRARTVLKVATEIVRQQDAFLTRGIHHLRPLNLKTVADAIQMHESTVSRVTSNKYMATPRGTFELKFFFTAAIASADGGEAHSAEAVRHRIRGLIDAEPADDVLSDDQIVAALRADGVDIARRTVAKYREAMHIASSVQRRREKRAPR